MTDAPTGRKAPFTLKWISEGRKAQVRSNPKFPDGIFLDMSDGKEPRCAIALPYPAPCVGKWFLTCDACGLTCAVTAAGRADDPKGLRLPCKAKH